jgi:5-methyltetrahydrofolate--homocysteine methyltransferase
MSPFLQAMRSGRVLLMDGAMGTELQRAGLRDGECGESWNLTHPERVQAIHQSYSDAGAEILLTNTFQADCGNLDRSGLTNRFDELWERAIQLARSGSPQGARVVADLGPFDVRSPEECRRLAAACSRADGIIIETLTNLDGGPTYLYKALHERDPAIPYLVSFTFLKHETGDIRTRRGQTPEECAWLARQAGANALGVNCGPDIGMSEVSEVVRRYRQRLGDSLPLFARPNAGTPKRTSAGWVYPQSPEMMAAGLPELLEAGVNMVGGCCGTTPAHIAAFRTVVDRWNDR